MTVHVSEILESSGVAKVQAASQASMVRPYRDVFKRCIDLVAASALLVVALPIIVLLSAAILLQGQSPFYVQPRIGKDGRVFRMLKIRSMVANAEAALEAYLATSPEARAEWDKNQKLKHDPRITPIGGFIRKTSLDELPQLWNVLIGDMSLVGPRPMMEDQRGLYRGRAYFTVRPGITGLWQISDRNECDFVQRTVFDEIYVRNMSFFGDIRILFRTVAVVLRGTGY